MAKKYPKLFFIVILSIICSLNISVGISIDEQNLLGNYKSQYGITHELIHKIESKEQEDLDYEVKWEQIYGGDDGEFLGAAIQTKDGGLHSVGALKRMVQGVEMFF